MASLTIGQWATKGLSSRVLRESNSLMFLPVVAGGRLRIATQCGVSHVSPSHGTYIPNSDTKTYLYPRSMSVMKLKHARFIQNKVMRIRLSIGCETFYCSVPRSTGGRGGRVHHLTHIRGLVSCNRADSNSPVGGTGTCELRRAGFLISRVNYVPVSGG